jgi:hypothetical protein
MEVKPELFSDEQARTYLGGISVSMLWRMRQAGDVESITIGRRRFYLRASLDAYIASRREAVAS